MRVNRSLGNDAAALLAEGHLARQSADRSMSCQSPLINHTGAYGGCNRPVNRNMTQAEIFFKMVDLISRQPKSCPLDTS